MKHALATLALAATTLATNAATTSCNSGPKQLTRTWDTKVNDQQAGNLPAGWYLPRTPTSIGALLQDILPVYPLVGFAAAVGDTFILNPIQFWGTRLGR